MDNKKRHITPDRHLVGSLGECEELRIEHLPLKGL